MSKFTNELTRREEKGLVDLEKFPHTRNDFPMILTVARILYRVQLRCFSQDGITDLDITKILNNELNRLQMCPNLFVPIESYHRVNNPGTFNFVDQLTNSQTPLDTIRNLLTGDIGPRKHKGEKTNIRRIYKNLLVLTEDLKKAIVQNSQSNLKESTKHDFHHINFSPTKSLISEEGDEATIIEPPLPILWLPTLTNKEKITQRKASAFSLRKRKGFNTSTKYRHRLLRMPHVQAISKKTCATGSITNSILGIRQKNLATVAKICMPSESIIIDIEDYQYTSSSRSRPTRAGHGDYEKQGKNLMSLQNLDNPLPSDSSSKLKSAFSQIEDKNHANNSNNSSDNSDLIRSLPSINYVLNSIPRSEYVNENCSCQKRLTFDFRQLCLCITSLKHNVH
ncbi:628_t:CDS:1 [Ambispora gerdemannii]|uniref:628_t:CDS:1 n=1 Tax=Ambispora gerdemannii TaxID=144530 RepID=A0A9N8VV70_9GLOM|nr:628_t:CDS:1 [Ambispora gerdemannii]